MKKALKYILKTIVIVALVVLTYHIVPVPSAQTPNARLELNTWANGKSAELALLGYKIMVDTDSPKATVENQSLCIYRNAGRIPDILTFHYDNIVAIGFRTLLLVIIGAFMFYWPTCRKEYMNRISIVMASALIFIIALIVRDISFGIYVHSHPVEAIGGVDDIIRKSMIWLMMVPLLAVLRTKRGSANEEK